jgi:hypothetical protein
MGLEFECTEKDYVEASAAHGVWAKLEARADRAPGLVLNVGLYAFFFALLLFVLFGDDRHSASQAWRVTSRNFIAANLALPGFFVIVTLQLLMKLIRYAPHSVGLIQQVVPERDRAASMTKMMLAVIPWILMFAGLWYIYALQERDGRAAIAAGKVDVAPPVKDIDNLPFVALLIAGFLPSLLLQIIISVILRKLQAKTFVRGQPQLFVKSFLEFDDEGLRLSSLLMSTHWKWPAIVKFTESKNLFLLYNSQLSFQMIPKRSLVESGSLESFVMLLTKHVYEGVLNPRRLAAGFPVQPVPVSSLTQLPPE